MIYIYKLRDLRASVVIFLRFLCDSVPLWLKVQYPLVHPVFFYQWSQCTRSLNSRRPPFLGGADSALSSSG